MSFFYRTEVELVSARHGLSADLVQAVSTVESSGNRWAWNPEPKYRYFWDVKRKRPFRAVTEAEISSERPPLDFRGLIADHDQEWWAQQASWGLMQVMGAVARERGFAEPYLTQLLDAEYGLELGCRHLAALFAWSRGDLRSALAAYNGGPSGNKPGEPLRNAEYADKVLAELAKLT